MTGRVTIGYRRQGFVGRREQAVAAKLADEYDRDTLLRWMLAPWQRYDGYEMNLARGASADVDVDGLRPDQHAARAAAAARALDGTRA